VPTPLNNPNIRLVEVGVGSQPAQKSLLSHSLIPRSGEHWRQSDWIDAVSGGKGTPFHRTGHVRPRPKAKSYCLTGIDEVFTEGFPDESIVRRTTLVLYTVDAEVIQLASARDAVVRIAFGHL
jgi:hypothetical protein